MRRCIKICEHGAADVLKFVEEAFPAAPLGKNEVVVKTRFAGVNYIDTYFRSGLYKPAALPFVPGSEGCGTVVQAGGDAAHLLGKTVTWFASSNGSYTDVAVHKSSELFPVPDGLLADRDLAQLTTLFGIQGLTAHYLVTSCFNVRPGTTVLLNAAAGGTGLLISQMAKIKGAARVIGIASGVDKLELAKRIGKCDIVIDRNSAESWVEQVKAASGGAGVDVFFDGAGKATFESGGLGVLKRRGSMVTFGNASGAVPPIAPLELTRFGSISLQRPKLGDFVADPAELQERFADISKMVRENGLETITTKIPLEKAAEAHALLEGGKTTGKLLLDCEKL